VALTTTELLKPLKKLSRHRALKTLISRLIKYLIQYHNHLMKILSVLSL